MFDTVVKAIAEAVFVKNWPSGKMRQFIGIFAILSILLINIPSMLESAETKQSEESAQQVSSDFSNESSDFSSELASYIGPEACKSCHEEKYQGFIQTAHHITSRLADRHSISGDFDPEAATMWTRNANLWFEMSAREDGFYQTANIWENNELREHSERMDIVTGSGKIGQTYLYWKADRLYQLPISYWAASGKWINSPGYLDGQAIFNRPVGPRCMECHATYFAADSYQHNVYDQERFMLGISCERCHGPGADHANNQTSHPEGTAADFIIHPGNLARQRSIEVCAQCHSGPGIKRGLPFTYRPGQPLNNYIEPEPHETQNKIGVHSNNQVARLSLSTCFQQSDDMTCVSCHNPHVPERGKRALFSEHCLECHNSEECGMEPQLGHAISDNCIDCHMPERQDKKTRVQSANSIDLPTMPDHLIGIYPDATQIFMQQQRATRE